MPDIAIHGKLLVMLCGFINRFTLSFRDIEELLHYLWRAVDQDGDEIDILIQKRKDNKAARRSFRKLLKGQQAAPIKIVTDKLRSYSAAMKDLIPEVGHSTKQYENNRCELSHQLNRQQERQCRRSVGIGFH